METFQWEGRAEEWGEEVQGLRSIIGRHKIDGERPKIVQETDNLKNLHAQTMNMN